MKYFAALIVGLFASLLLYAISDFPVFGDPYSPANNYVAAYYIENSMTDGNVPNVVTSVLADYRSFDTMFETGVVFVAALGILAIMKRSLRQREPVSVYKKPSVIVRVAARFMIPFMQLFSLYVLAHGHYSPGGGFQGGVILGASLILYGMVFGLPSAFRRLSERHLVILSGVGVLIFSGIGAISMLLGGNFLDYSVWAPLLPATDEVMARSHGMLGVEIGVALTVMCGMMLIYSAISSDGKMDQGL